MADPMVCARCGGACCGITSGQEEFCFPLSDIELDRIRQFAPAKGWFAQEPNSSAFIGHVSRLFPGEQALIEQLFNPRKHHMRLAVNAAGQCTFVGPQGCILPTEARPYYCRIFPLWDGDAGLNILAAEGCLALREARGVGPLLASLGLTPAKARDLHARLRLAWGLPPKRTPPAGWAPATDQSGEHS